MTTKNHPLADFIRAYAHAHRDVDRFPIDLAATMREKKLFDRDWIKFWGYSFGTILRNPIHF